MRIISDKLFQVIGLSKRAGKLVSGDFMVEKSIRTGKAKLVIMSENASPNTEKKYMNLCKFMNVDIVQFGCEEDLGRSIGKTQRTLLAVTDMAFKGMIMDALPSSVTNTGVID